MSRYRTTPTRNGVVIQSGLDARDRNHVPRMQPQRGPYRAVVVRSYVHGSEGNTRRAHKVTADVILVHSMLPLHRLPVLQRNFGVNNVHSLYIPRPSTRTIQSGVPVNFRSKNPDGSFGGLPSNLADLDGDQVLVDFVEGDLDFPVIVGSLDHQQTKRKVKEAGTEWGEPQKDEYYVHHYGTEVRIDSDGNLLIDTSKTYGSDIVEEESANGEGNVRFRIKNDRRFSVEMDGTIVFEVFKNGSQVRVDLGEGAGERIVLGDSFLTLFNSHTHPTGTGPSGTPTQQMSSTHLSDLTKTKKS